jgi:multidrug efflux pump subunit AcrA (membrane-fusion protein)
VKSVLLGLLRTIIAVAVIAAGAGAMLLLIKSKPAPKKEARPVQGALVEVVTVGSAQKQLTVRAQGTVTAARKVVLQPEVTGRVTWQSKELVPGGRFEQGQAVLRVDARDYVLAARQQDANVDRARLELQVEKSRKEIAKQEWEIIGEEANASPEGRALALREPQLEVAEAAVESAESARAQAKLALGRTGIAAPFNGFIQAENVDVGQLVSPASQLAVLVGTDAFWIQVSIPVEQLAWIDVPGLNAMKGEGSPTKIYQEVGGETSERDGQVIRLLGDLDPVGRMARVLIEVKDPMGLNGHQPLPADGKGRKHGSARKATAGGEDAPDRTADLPLLIGAYVDVEIQARQVHEVVEIPRRALREGEKVYVYGPDQKLVVRNIQIVWRSRKSVLVRSGVSAGEQLITSRLPGAVPGMLLRKAEPAEPAAVGKR